MAQHVERFQGWSDRYAGFRPSYPDTLLKTLSHLILDEPPPSGGVVADIGSGTGIFTRQLRASLPVTIPILGIEPASDMRREAQTRSPVQSGIEYLDGTAESIPLAAESVRAVVAATAAHWFHRPAYYNEARRTLMPFGVMAIVEYVRDEEASPAAAAVVDFLKNFGGPRAYAPPDYEAELGTAMAFLDFQSTIESVTLQLTPCEFLGLALSSSHARAAIQTLGRKKAEKLLLKAVDRLILTDGCIPYGHRFRMYSARRGAVRGSP
jgi:SAM-dependent methyltransferase